MGFFTCNTCGESVKKNSVDKHSFKCSISEGLSCMDCNKLFWKNTYSSHDSCITEDQKYGGRNYVSKPFAGKVKQEHFIQMLNEYVKTATNIPPNIRRILRHLATLPNVPKKEKAFMNFIQMNGKVSRPQAEQVWGVVKKISATQPPQKKANEATKTDGSSKALQNGSSVIPPPGDTPTKEGKKNKNEGEEKEKKNKNGKQHSRKRDQENETNEERENEENDSKNRKKNRENSSKKRKQEEEEGEQEEEEEKQSVKKRKQEKEAEREGIKESLNSIKKKKNKKSKTSKQQQQPQNDVQTPSSIHQNGISTTDTNWMGDQPNFKWKVAIRRALKTADGKIKLKKLEKIVVGEFLQSLPGGDDTKKLEAKKLFATKIQNHKYVIEEKYVTLKE